MDRFSLHRLLLHILLLLELCLLKLRLLELRLLLLWLSQDLALLDLPLVPVLGQAAAGTKAADCDERGNTQDDGANDDEDKGHNTVKEGFYVKIV